MAEVKRISVPTQRKALEAIQPWLGPAVIVDSTCVYPVLREEESGLAWRAYYRDNDFGDRFIDFERHPHADRKKECQKSQD
jgi:hypothetical protein